jgi:hypothetical protein
MPSRFWGQREVVMGSNCCLRNTPGQNKLDTLGCLFIPYFTVSLFQETIHRNPTDGIKRCPFSGFWKLMPNRHQLFVESDSIRLRRPTARPIG